MLWHVIFYALACDILFVFSASVNSLIWYICLFIYVLTYYAILLYPATYKVRVLCYTVRSKVCIECPSVCPFVRTHFVSALYLDHFLTDFLQILHNSLYWGGVVYDCRSINKHRVIALDSCRKLVTVLFYAHFWPIAFKLCL